jgi:hypothetical protein
MATELEMMRDEIREKLTTTEKEFRTATQPSRIKRISPARFRKLENLEAYVNHLKVKVAEAEVACFIEKKDEYPKEPWEEIYDMCWVCKDDRANTKSDPDISQNFRVCKTCYDKRRNDTP